MRVGFAPDFVDHDEIAVFEMLDDTVIHVNPVSFACCISALFLHDRAVQVKEIFPCGIGVPDGFIEGNGSCCCREQQGEDQNRKKGLTIHADSVAEVRMHDSPQEWEK